MDAYADRHEALSHRDAMLVVLGVFFYRSHEFQP
jgi:hypothetical protein